MGAPESTLRSCCLGPVAYSVDGSFPRVSAYDLNGTPVELPTGLPGERTIILIAFHRWQQECIDTWTRGLCLDKESTAVPWIELPVIQDPGPIGRCFIDNGMRSGIRSRTSRRHVVTLYLDKDRFLESVNIDSDDAVHALVVDRTGLIHAHIAGNFSPTGGRTIMAAVGEPEPPSQ